MTVAAVFAGLGRPAQRRDLAPLRQPLQGARLDLPHALAGQAQLSPDFLERLRIGVAVHPIAELDDVALSPAQATHARVSIFRHMMEFIPRMREIFAQLSGERGA